MWLQKLDEVVGEALHGWQVPLLVISVLKPVRDAAFSSTLLQDASGGSTHQPWALDNQTQLGQEVSPGPPVSCHSSMYHQTAFLFAS